MMRKAFFLIFVSLAYSCCLKAADADACYGKEPMLETKVRKAACEQLINQSKNNNTINLLARAYFKLSQIAYAEHDYDESENLLFILKSNYPQYLENRDKNHQWFYQMGKVKLRGSQYKNAILNFQEALRIGKDLVNNQYIAYSLNGLGLSYQRIKQYQQALSYYQDSLAYKKKFGMPEEIGITLNNIANVYDLLEDHKNALEYYLKALQQYNLQSAKRQGLQYHIAHCHENIGVVLKKLGSYQSSIAHFESALGVIDAHKLDSNKVNLLTYMASSYLGNGKQDKAFEFYNSALVEDQDTDHGNAFLRYEMANFLYQKSDWEQALKFADQGINMAVNNDHYANTLVKLYDLKSQILQDLGLLPEAMQSLRVHDNLRENLLENKFNQDIRNKLHQIEIEQKQHELQLLEKENQLNAIKINRQYWIIFSWVLLSFMAVFYIHRLLKRKSVEKNRLLMEIKAHRDKLLKLEGSKGQLKELFKDTSDAILCVDSGWRLAFHNKRFEAIFNETEKLNSGGKLKTILPDFFSVASQMPMDSNDMPRPGVIEGFSIKLGSEQLSVNIRVHTINLLDDFAVFSVTDKKNSQVNEQVSELLDQQNALNIVLQKIEKNSYMDEQHIETIKNELKDSFLAKRILGDVEKNKRGALVDLMLDCIQVWNAHTKTNRIELAEASGYWKVSIDDGRLRTRALDRYLDAKHLPKNPRWRQVVKTAHFILSECDLINVQRDKLNNSLDLFLSLNKLT